MKYNIGIIIRRGCEIVTELGSYSEVRAYKVVTGCILDKIALR